MQRSEDIQSLTETVDSDIKMIVMQLGTAGDYMVLAKSAINTIPTSAFFIARMAASSPHS
jgi:hypothetical protein